MAGAGATRFRVAGLLRSLNLFETSDYAFAAMLPQARPSPCNRRYGSAPDRPVGGDPVVDQSEDDFLRILNFGGKNGRDGRGARDAQRSSSSGASDRPVRGDKRLDGLFTGDDADENVRRSVRGRTVSPPISRPMRGEGREGVTPRERTGLDEEFSGRRLGGSRQSSRVDTVARPSGGFSRGERSGNLPADDFKIDSPSTGSLGGERRDDQPVSSLLQKLKFGGNADEEKAREKPPVQAAGTDAPLPESSFQDADDIFRKMKETGLIPNAVAMLDGLCKDGLIQDAMKLFGLMREKGTIPDVVIYTAVVEGFCKAAKYDDAKRVFRKMQNIGISPNAFSYKVLIEGLFKGKRLEDSVEICLEMLDFGQSPSVVTFTGLVDELCKEKGVEEAESVVRRLREKGLALYDKSIREYLDKKGPISPLVWEAIFGKKVSKGPF